MAKNMFIDGSWVIMHFNGSIQSYFEAKKLGPTDIECYKCHQRLSFDMPSDIGTDQFKKCPHCRTKVNYTTLYLTEELARLFDVRGGTIYGSPLSIGGIMHIGLPAEHPEFDALITGNRNEIIQNNQSSSVFRLIELTCAVANSSQDIFYTKGEEIHRRKAYGKESQQIFAIMDTFIYWGKAIHPSRSHDQKSEFTQQEISSATTEFVQYLLDEYKHDQFTKEMIALKVNLLPICFSFIQKNFSELKNSSSNSTGFDHESNQFSSDKNNKVGKKGIDIKTALNLKKGMDREKYDSLVKEGNEYYYDHEYKKAILIYEKALKIYTKDPASWNNKGLCLAELEKHREAIKCYEIALDINPTYATAWANKGISLDALNQNEKAIESFEKALSLNPKFLIAWLQKGICLAHLNRHEDALECYNQCLEIDPGHVDSWHNKAISTDTLGRKKEAIIAYRRFLVNFVDSGLIGVELIQQVKQRIHDLENKPWEIISVTQPQTTLIDGKVFVFSSLCLYSSVQDLDELINQITDLNSFGKQVDLNKHINIMSPEIQEIFRLYNQALNENTQGKFNDAIDSYKKVLAIAPDFAAARYNLAAAYMRFDRDFEALEELEKALTNSQYDADIYQKLGYLYEKHDVDRAIQNHQKALKLKPYYINSLLGLGSCLMKKGLFDDAEKVQNYGLDLLDKNQVQGNHSADLQEEKHDFLTNLIVIRAQKEDINGAIEIAQKGLEKFPNDKKFVEMLAELKKPSTRPSTSPVDKEERQNETFSQGSNNRTGKEIDSQKPNFQTDSHTAKEWFDLGTRYMGEDNFEVAHKCFIKTLESEKENPLSWFEKGQCEESLKYWEDAIQSYRQILTYAEDPLLLKYATLRIKEIEEIKYPTKDDQLKLINSNSESINHRNYFNSPMKAHFKPGDIIGDTAKLEILRVLGYGAFGMVYLASDAKNGEVYALKTFRDEYFANAQIKDLFQKEARLWVDLEFYPYLVRAYWVNEISGRLFIAMEYIAPKEHGINTLEDYIFHQPPDLAQSLRWAIQICYGMEYAYSKGIRAHRDIKPANIMINKDGMIKITDFGLASSISVSLNKPKIHLIRRNDILSISGQTQEGGGIGTLTHMPPEQFINSNLCDERSDIYAVGVVLFQMASAGRFPFMASRPRNDTEEEWLRFGEEMKRLHEEAPIPKLTSPLFPIIQHCMEKSPGRRYQLFKELRKDLERLLLQETGEELHPPQPHELEAWEWINKGFSLNNLSQSKEAISCLDKALELDPLNKSAWSNKNVSLRNLGRFEEAIYCCDKILDLDPKDGSIWTSKGNSLGELGRLEEAIPCYNQALNIDLRDSGAWFNKSISLNYLGKYEEALYCCDKALELDPKAANVWVNKGASLGYLDRKDEAIICFDKAIELDPHDITAWNNKAAILNNLGHHEAAFQCYKECLEIEPNQSLTWYNLGLSRINLGYHEEAINYFNKALELNPRFSKAWSDKGACLDSLGRRDEAIICFFESRQIDPSNAGAWYNEGNTLESMGRHEEAILSVDQAIKLNPRYSDAWYIKGNSLGSLGRPKDAIDCYDKALELDPRNLDAWCNKGNRLSDLGNFKESIRCFDKALELDPRDEGVWFNKAHAQDQFGSRQDAVNSYRQFLAIAPTQYSRQIEFAHERIRDLENI